MTRTAQQEFLLADFQFKAWIEQLIDKLCEIYYVERFNETKMDNHYHLSLNIRKPSLMDPLDVEKRFDVLQNLNKRKRHWVPNLAKKHFERFTSLSWFMWDLNRRIAIHYNRLHGTKGHFWGERFKSVVIEGDQNLLRVMAYIEQNAVRAGLVERPSQYKAGTAGRIARGLSKGRIPNVPAVGFLKNFQGKKRAEAYITWMNFLSDLMRFPDLKRGIPPLHVRKLFSFELDSEFLGKTQASIQNREASQWHRNVIKRE